MNVLVLTQNDMKRVFSMQDAIQADKDALALYSGGKSNIPLRVNLDVKEFEGQSLYMPGYAKDAGALGVKIVSVYPKNIEKGITGVPSTMVLLDSETGQVCSIMDGTYLTRVRTGAVSGAATSILAREDSKVFALFGTGGQAETQLEAILTTRKISLVKVFDISIERAANFAQRMSDEFGKRFSVTITPASSSDQAIDGADIITAVTTTKTPVFNGKLVKKGCHINGVGSYMPDMQEIDEHIVTTARVVYVDTRNGALNEAGDLTIPIKKGSLDPNKAVELGEVIIGKAQGRISNDEVTFFKTTGSAILDIVTARRIYENAVAQGIGAVLEF